MTLLVTGGNGQLGRALRGCRPEHRFVDLPDVDITDRGCLQALSWSGVDGIVNAAAWTQVDAAEAPFSLLDAWEVNVTGVANLAAHARRLQIPFVQVSTDYVFAGDARSPIPVDAPLDPVGMYGIAKAASEMAARIAPAHYVVRTSWVFGDGPNFVRTMLRLAATRDELTVVDDQLGRPTYAVDLAAAIMGLLERGAPPGTYHATGDGEVVSWARFAAEILAAAGSATPVRPVSTATYLAAAPTSAPRPAYGALDLRSLTAAGLSMRDWRAALAEYLDLEGVTGQWRGDRGAGT